MAVFGTRPETIKLAPVLGAIRKREPRLHSVAVLSGQHNELLYPFVRFFGIPVKYDLAVMVPQQTLTQVCARVIEHLEVVLTQEKPDLLLVQGDTATALAAALAAFYHKVPVGHVEAGLRTDDRHNPFPEEMNRRLITQLATYHFAATEFNRSTLRGEGVPGENIFVTGNPVVDAVLQIQRGKKCSPATEEVIAATRGMKRVVLTTHRRESFGETMSGHLQALRRFVEGDENTCLLFPVHPNPNVVRVAQEILAGHPRVHLLAPLDYPDFIRLLSESWLIVSDSGGVQEEAPTLGRPVLVIRETTERPEAVAAGVARLIHGGPEHLAAALADLRRDDSWIQRVKEVENPFGRGNSGELIAAAIEKVLLKGSEDDEHLPAGRSHQAAIH